MYDRYDGKSERQQVLLTRDPQGHSLVLPNPQPQTLMFQGDRAKLLSPKRPTDSLRDNSQFDNTLKTSVLFLYAVLKYRYPPWEQK